MANALATDDWEPVTAQSQSADDWEPVTPSQPKGALTETPGESASSWVPKVAGTIGINAASGVVGLPKDIMNLSDYIAARAQSLYTKEDPAKILERWNTAQKQDSFDPGNYLPSSSDVQSYLSKNTGVYHPSTELGKLGMTAGETALGMLAPSGLETAAERGVKDLVPFLTETASKTIKAAPTAAASGVAGQGAADLTGDPLAGLAAGVAVPAIGSKVAQTAKNMFPSVQTKANRFMADAATDPEKIAANPTAEPIIPGYTPTLAESSLDPGLLQTQKAYSDASPEFGAKVKDIQGQQNVARATELNKLADPNADVMSPGQLFHQHADAIDAAENANIQALQRAAETANRNLPAGTTPEQAGESLRASIQNVHDAAHATRADLYRQVDPYGSLNLVTETSGDAGRNIISQFNPKLERPSPIAMPIVEMSANLPKVMPFDDLMKFNRTVTAAMSEARRSGDHVGTAQLTQIKSAVQSDISNALNNQANWHAQNANSTSPITPQVPNFSPTAGRRLADANANHAQFAQTYREKPIQPTLQTNGFVGQYKMPNSAVPAASFPGGDRGFETTSAFIKAAARDDPQSLPQVLGALKDTAAYRLREMMGSNELLTPEILQKWQSRYGSSLRAIEAADPGYMQQFRNTADATSALTDAQARNAARMKEVQSSAASKLINAQTPDEVVSHISSILTTPSKSGELRAIINQIGTPPTAQAHVALEGVRRAGIEGLMNRIENAGIIGGQNVVSYAKLKTLVDKNSNAIEALYGRDGLDNMKAVLADMERSQAAFDAIKTQGSPTSQNLSYMKQLAAHAKSSHPNIATVAWIEGLEGLHHGSLVQTMGSVAAVAATRLWDAMKSRNIGKMNDLIQEGLLNPAVGKRMIEAGLTPDGKVNVGAMNRLTAALLASNVGPLNDPSKHAIDGRIERASGGRTGIDHAARAASLIRSADHAKKSVNKTTEPLLNVNDSIIAKALAVANKTM